MAFPTGYAGYDTITPANPTASLTDFFYILNANLLSASWWANVKSDGGDVYAYNDATADQFPVYLHNWDYGANTGLIFFQFTGTKATSAEAVRIYAGNASNSQPAAGDAYGQHAVFPSHVRGFWPDSGGNDLTSYANHLTANGGVTSGGVAGPITSSLATDFDASDDYFHTTVSVPTTQPLSMLTSIYRDATGSTHIPISVGDTATDVNYSEMRVQTDQVNSTDRGSAFAGATGGSTLSASTWYRIAAMHNSATSRRAILNGVQQASNTTSVSLSGFDQIRVGAATRGTAPSSFMNGRLAFVALHTANLSDAWLAHDSAMLATGSQSGFYTAGGWTAVGSAAVPRANLMLTGVGA